VALPGRDKDKDVALIKNMVGKKIIMAITGFALSLYVVMHLLGNISFFSGPDGINAYANMLHGLGPLLWVVRLAMAVALGLHMVFGIQLTIENRTARPQKYAVSKHLSATVAGRSMIWTGLLIAFYLGYHLLHFTVQIIAPEFAAGRNFDALGRPDVFSMVKQNFQSIAVSMGYIAAMAAVCLHLSHGLQSMLQTVGLNNDRTMPVMVKIGAAAAIILFFGYASIPAGIISRFAGR
jgi:succinate dehydrogenase / fumarate reductase cytochrome b subunit